MQVLVVVELLVVDVVVVVLEVLVVVELVVVELLVVVVVVVVDVVVVVASSFITQHQRIKTCSLFFGEIIETGHHRAAQPPHPHPVGVFSKNI